MLGCYKLVNKLQNEYLFNQYLHQRNNRSENTFWKNTKPLFDCLQDVLEERWSLASESSDLGFSRGRVHCVVFLGKTLHSDSASLHPGE